MSQSGIIFNIQRYTIHDGPGIRTEIFLKGCPMRCSWCSNPESHTITLQPGIYPTKCIGKDKCGQCQLSCPENCLHFKDNQFPYIDRSLCTNCMKCTQVCPSDAIRSWGKDYTATEVMNIIKRDRSFYEKSGGGVTFSGGEPFMQHDFLLTLLKECKKEQIHTCVESTLHTSWSKIEETLPHTDMLIVDLKHMDDSIHQKYMGVSNRLVLENLEKLSLTNTPMILRIPLIPGVNDSTKNIAASANFIKNNLNGNILRLQLLEFMHLGEEKYNSLNIPYPMQDWDYAKDSFTERIRDFADYFNNQGITCSFGHTTKEGKKP